MASIVHFTREEITNIVSPSFYLDSENFGNHLFICPLQDDGTFLETGIDPIDTRAIGVVSQYLFRDYGPARGITKKCLLWYGPPKPGSSFGPEAIPYAIRNQKGSAEFSEDNPQEMEQYHALITLLVESIHKTIALSSTGEEYTQAFINTTGGLQELDGFF